MISIYIDTTGPVFDARAYEIVDRFALAAAEAVAEEGERRVKDRLATVLQHPTGYYVDHIDTERIGSQYRVHDSNVRYGHWLAGGTKRNQSTEFPGYDTFATVGDALQVDAVEIAQGVLPPYLAELNGGR
jgi:hypothetical protein